MAGRKADSGPGLLSLRAYARHRKDRGLPGTTLSCIQRALARGRIFRRCEEHERCPLTCSKGRLDPLQADLDWTTYTDPAKPGRPRVPIRKPEDVPKTPDAAISVSRQHEVHYKSELKRLEYEEKVGALISAEEVRRERFDWGREVRDVVLAVPRRVSAQLAAEEDSRRVEILLDQELRKAIERVSYLEEKPEEVRSD